MNDQLGTITYARHLAVAVLDIITSMTSEHADKNIFNQTYNFSSEGITSWYDIANEIMKEAELNCKVLPVSTSAYPTATARPQWSVMAKTKSEKHLGWKYRIGTRHSKSVWKLSKLWEKEVILKVDLLSILKNLKL